MTLSATDLLRLDVLVDTLLPGGSGFPPASTIGLSCWIADRSEYDGVVQAILGLLSPGFPALRTSRARRRGSGAGGRSQANLRGLRGSGLCRLLHEPSRPRRYRGRDRLSRTPAAFRLCADPLRRGDPRRPRTSAAQLARSPILVSSKGHLAMQQNPVPWLVERVVNTGFDDLGEVAVDKAKTFLLDTFGVGVAGCAGFRVDKIIKVASAWGSGRRGHGLGQRRTPAGRRCGLRQWLSDPQPGVRLRQRGCGAASDGDDPFGPVCPC